MLNITSTCLGLELKLTKVKKMIHYCIYTEISKDKNVELKFNTTGNLASTWGFMCLKSSSLVIHKEGSR
jgi:hypothetical protein